MIGLLLTALLAAKEPPPPPRAGPPPGAGQGAEPGASRPDPPLSGEDAEVVENLELLEKLELLQDLSIVDTGDDPDPPGGAKAQKGR